MTVSACEPPSFYSDAPRLPNKVLNTLAYIMHHVDNLVVRVIKRRPASHMFYDDNETGEREVAGPVRWWREYVVINVMEDMPYISEGYGVLRRGHGYWKVKG